MKLTDYIKQSEGFDEYPRTDTDGHLVLGHGHDIESHPCSRDVALTWLLEDILWATEAVKKVVHVWLTLEEPRRFALIDMCFNLGETKFRKFKGMIGAVNRLNFDRAVSEIQYHDPSSVDDKLTLYYEKLTSRAERNMAFLRTGKFDEED